MAIARALAGGVGLGVLVLLGSGHTADPILWSYCGVALCGMLIASMRLDPQLLAERRKPGPDGLDRFTVVSEQVLIGAHLLLSVADLRWGWMPNLPDAWRWGGVGALAAGGALLIASMACNPFFSTMVRIQEERGHRLVADGPYAYVRHPGYLATLALFLGSGLGLGSWAGLAPIVILLPIVIRRTALEDAFLLRALPGYAEYAMQVPARLIRGLW